MKLFFAAFLGAFFLTGVAHAGQSVIVVVHPADSASKRAAQYLSYGFREALNKTADKYQLVSPTTLYGDREVDVQKLAKDADALAAEGQTAYDNLDTDKAKQKFDEALALYEQNMGEFDNMRPAARLALLSAGAVLVNDPTDKNGRAQIQRALLFDPNVQPDPRVYNSAMLAAFKDVRSKLNKAQKGSLAITTNPAYAELYVDGDFIGMTPDKIDRIDGGPHLVRVVRDGFRATAEVVDVKPGRNETSVTLNLVAMPQQQQVMQMIEKAAGEVKNPTSPTASALAAKGKGLFVVVCSVSVNGDQVKATTAVFHADNRRVGFGERTFSASMDTYREEAMALWDTLQKDMASAPSASASGGGKGGGTAVGDGGGKGKGSGKVEAVETVKRDSGKTKPVVCGVLLGVGGAALVTGGVFGILSLLGQTEYRNLQQIDTTVPAKKADLELKRLLTDVLIFSGAGIAVAGLFVLIFWEDRPAQKKGTLGLGPVDLDFSVTSQGAYVGARGVF